MLTLLAHDHISAADSVSLLRSNSQESSDNTAHSYFERVEAVRKLLCYAYLDITMPPLGMVICYSSRAYLDGRREMNIKRRERA